MGKFVTGKELEEKICDIIWEAKENLIILSPFIKLDDFFKKHFDKHINNHSLHILIVFGKNEKAVNKSFNKNDFDYFKKFPNISIVYVSNLHAKYYGNEKKGVLTSINLYDYSFINNIEFGVYSEQSFLGNIKNDHDSDAWKKCWEIAKKNEVVFIKRPVYEHKNILVTSIKNYSKSDVLLDETERFYGLSYKSRNINNYIARKLSDFPDELKLGASNAERPKREDENIKTKDRL